MSSTLPRHTLIAVLVALCVPTAVTWSFFYGWPGSSTTQWLYGAQKFFMVLWPWFFGGRPLPHEINWRPTPAAIKLGLLAGLGVVAATLILYFGLLRDTEVFLTVGQNLRTKLTEFGVTTVTSFWALAIFISLVNSGLEEYYWRWFGFGKLRIKWGALAAALVTSGAFIGHHVVVLSAYFPPEMFWIAAVPFAAAAGVGGLAWCWVYHRSQDLWAAWLSHLLIDLGIMIVGHDLLFRAL